jgi:hypothetical protein
MITKKITLSLVALLLLAITLSSCAGTNSFTAGRPKDEAFRTVLKKQPSTINIPIDVSADELSRVLNQTIRKELYKGSTRTIGLNANVLRNGQIAVSAADNYLYVTLPIAISLSYGIFEMPAISMKLKFKATAGITPDWRLHSEIYYMGLSDLLAEEVRVGPLSLKPRSIVEGITQPVQKVLSDLIAQKINDMIPLKSQIAKVWNTLQKPILLDKNYNAWLKLAPLEVMLYPLYAQNNMLRLGVGISAFAELAVGKEPPAQPLLPLPNLKLVNTFDKAFRIVLSADLFYKDLRVIASALLLNKQFGSDGKNIVIKDIELYGNGDKLVIKLQTEGSLDGLFYLTAKPVFNPQTDVFSVEDVDFDMQTTSLLLKSADWLLHSAIRSNIQEKLNMNLTEQLERTRQMAGKALAKVQLVEHVFLKGGIKNLKFNDMIIREDKISIQVYSEGETAIFFE